MGGWHPLDGSMIAADRYYNQPDKYDFDRCRLCAELFWDVEDGDTDTFPLQSDKHWDLCVNCEDM